MHLRITIGLLLFILGLRAYAQPSVADSLEHLVRSVPSDTTKVWLLNSLVHELRERDNNRALAFAKQAKELAELLNDKKGLAKALENYGWLLYRKGDFSKSLEISSQARQLSEELNDIKGVAKALVNVAAIHFEQKQYADAIEYFRQANIKSRQVGDTLTMARCFNNAAYSYFALNELDSATHHATEAYRLGKRIGNAYMVAFSKRTIGDVFLSRRQFEKANEAFSECYRISLQIDNNFLRSSVLHRLGNTAFSEKRYDDAINYLNENISIANTFGFKDELERAYYLASEVYRANADPVNAFAYLSKYVALHDSLHNQRSSEQIALMQSKHNTDLKQAQIEILTKDAALKTENIKQQRVWIYFFAGCFTLLFVLAVVLYQNNKHNRRARISLQEKNREIQTQTRQLKNLNTTKDKLFSIISHDLRSPVASLKALMEIVNTSGLSQEEFVEITKVLKRNLDVVYDDLDNLLFWAQTQLRGLQVTKEPLDLRKIAEEKVEFFAEQLKSKRITVRNEIPSHLSVVADRNHLGLVFRNLLANAIKFNRDGGSVRMQVSERNGHYEVSVSDSGVGMSKDDVAKLFNAETHFTKPGTRQEKGVGIGLLLTKEFVERNEGSIWVSSEPGHGATFTFTIKASHQPEYSEIAP